MNKFQEKYWDQQAEKGKENWRYTWFAWPIGVAATLVFFFNTDKFLLLVLKSFFLSLVIGAVIEAVFNLPHPSITDDKKNLVEVRTGMILAPLIGYIMAIAGYADQFNLSLKDIVSLLKDWLG